MSKVMITAESLKEDIQATFPIIDMPPSDELVLHKNNCLECDSLRSELEGLRGKKISGAAIRSFHQELSNFSGKGLQWVLPYYLRYCLTPEAAYTRGEIEFLVYNLGPRLEFQSAACQRFSRLNATQVTCLIHFLEWCFEDVYWGDYFPEDITRAINFLRVKKI
jgi:hypothetical protein